MNHDYTLCPSLRLLKMPFRVSTDLSNSLKTNSKSVSELRRKPRPLSLRLQQKPSGYLLIMPVLTLKNVFTYCWHTFYEMCSYIKKLM